MSLESAALASLAAYVAPGGTGPFFAATGGPADHVAAMERPGALPGAYVVLEDIETEDNRVLGGVRQNETETLAVWLCVGNTVDGSGAASVGDMRAALDAANGALHGLLVDGYYPIEKRGGRLIGYDRGTLWRVAYYVALRDLIAPNYP